MDKKHSLSNNSITVEYVPLDKIVDLDPRSYYPDLEHLAESIQEDGLQDPVHLLPLPDGRYAIASGRARVASQRQLAAEGKTQYSEIASFIRPEICVTRTTLVANTQRKEMDVFDEASLLEEFRRKNRLRFAADVSKALHLNERYVQRMMRANLVVRDIRDEYIEITRETLEEWGYLPFKKTQILEMAQLPAEKHGAAWEKMKNKAIKDRDKRERMQKQEKKPSPVLAFVNEERLPFSNELPENGNGRKEMSVQEAAVPAHLLEIERHAQFIEDPETRVGQLPLRSQALEEPIDLMMERIHAGLRLAYEDLCAVDPAGCPPDVSETMIDAIDAMAPTLSAIAAVADDLREKLMKGTSAVEAEYRALREEVVLEDGVDDLEDDLPVNLSKNSFDELYREQIGSMGESDKQEYEKQFHKQCRLNPGLKKTYPDLYEQLLTNLIINELNQERYRELSRA